MDTSRIHAVVIEFVRDLHPENAVDVVTSASFEDLGIDSMSTIDLLTRVEEEFGIEVPDDQLAAILTFGDLVDFVGREVGG